MAAAICSPSPECDGGKADYTNERVIFFPSRYLLSEGGGGNEEEGGEREEGGSLKFKHIILRRSLGAQPQSQPDGRLGRRRTHHKNRTVHHHAV